MIKFFRRIRRDLLSNNKIGKYLLYAFGEIVLVIIGILIALQINNRNELRKLENRELVLLASLREDILGDIEQYKNQDSLYAVIEVGSRQSIGIFEAARKPADLDTLNSIFNPLWNELHQNKPTYDEMLNTGSLYSMQNKDLQGHISKYYAYVKSSKYYINQIITAQGGAWTSNENLYPFKHILLKLRFDRGDFSNMDTSWFNNPNSMKYLAVHDYLVSNYMDNNIYRRNIYAQLILNAEELVEGINNEIENRRQ